MQINPLHPTLGAEIVGLDLRDPPDDAQLAKIAAAWARHAVIVFRDQSLEPEAQLRFSRRLGALDPAPAFDTKNSALAGYPEIAVVSNIKVEGEAIGGLGNGELAWHSDMTYVPAPPAACALHAQELPPAGGDTLFLDLRAAHAALPSDLASIAERIEILHDRAYTSAGTPRLGANAGDGTWHRATVSDPLSGRDVLFLGRRRNSRARTTDGSDATAQLDQLWEIADRPAHVYRHVWRPGDLLLWNNVATMHRRDAFDATARRRLYRTQIRRLHSHWEHTPWRLSA